MTARRIGRAGGVLWSACALTAAAQSLTLNGLPQSVASGQQINFGVALSSPAGKVVHGQIELAFQPDQALSRDDPAIQFATGGRTMSFAIAPNATTLASQASFQTGTVAGTITLTVSSDLGGGNLTRILVVGRASPSITNVTVTRNSSGFQVQVAGFANTCSLSTATFRFTAASGQTLQTSDLTVSLSTPASQWFNGIASLSFGGQFLVVVPFTVTQGEAAKVSAVAVQLQNGQGPSASAGASF